jgi:hypothetical protein
MIVWSVQSFYAEPCDRRRCDAPSYSATPSARRDGQRRTASPREQPTFLRMVRAKRPDVNRQEGHAHPDDYAPIRTRKAIVPGHNKDAGARPWHLAQREDGKSLRPDKGSIASRPPVRRQSRHGAGGAAGAALRSNPSTDARRLSDQKSDRNPCSAPARPHRSYPNLQHIPVLEACTRPPW